MTTGGDLDQSIVTYKISPAAMETRYFCHG